MNTVITMSGVARRRSRALLALATLTVPSSCRRPASPIGAGAPAGGPDVAIEQVGNWAGLRVRTVGERRKPKQVIILLHGWGAPGDDLVSIGELLAHPGRLWVFPQAPLISPGGGRAWWQLDLARMQAARERGQERELRQEVPAGLTEVRTQVTALVAEVTARVGIPSASVLIGGFSQGAMVATDVALASPGALGGLVALSGSLIAETEWTKRLQSVGAGFPVFMSHGRGDPVLPFRLAETLREKLQAVKWELTWVPFDGGHEIPPLVVTSLERFLEARSVAR